jgi:hypothetical protein
MLRISTAIVLAAAALAAGAYVALGAQLHRAPEHASAGHHASRSANAGLEVRGHLAGLYPGAKGRLRLRVKNRTRRGIRLRRVRVRVLRANAHCGPRALRAHPYRGRHWIPKRSAREISVWIRMHRRAGDACQGARFPLRYHARAVRRR